MIDEKIKEKIIKNAVSLQQFGINQLAWNKDNAEFILNSILYDKIGVLGGDVYEIVAGSLKPVYDNWACQQFQSETNQEFFLRSKRESLKYIKDYSVHTDENILFSIVFTESML